MSETTERQKWLSRPYESKEWLETDIQPTEELRRWLEFKPALTQKGDDDGR